MSRIRSRQPYARKPRRPRDSRSIPVWDETEQDNGLWYNCWWCGFKNSDQRSSLGDESTPNGVTHSDFTIAATAEPGIYGATSARYTSGGSSEYRSGGLPSVSLMLGGITLNQKTPIARAGSDGNPLTVVHYHDVSTNGGCSFCGSKNYRGDF